MGIEQSRKYSALNSDLDRMRKEILAKKGAPTQAEAEADNETASIKKANDKIFRDKAIREEEADIESRFPQTKKQNPRGDESIRDLIARLRAAAARSDEAQK